MIGKVINDRYHLIEELGRGGMGSVFKAFDQDLQREVAIKFLNQALFDRQERNRLIHEARLIAKLKHPNIVSVFDVGEFENFPYFVMEFVSGDSLRDRKISDLYAIRQICIQICQGIDHAHTNGIIHRDLKPENVLLDSDGRVKIADFGIAHSDVTLITETGTLSGTVNYMAPEIVKGDSFDGRADLYSLGVILYELTTGQLPFTADTMVAVISKHLFEEPVPPIEINPDLPPDFNQLILSLLSKDPNERPSSAAELIQFLDFGDTSPLTWTSPGTLSQIPSLDVSPPHNLTNFPSSFIGRREDLDNIGAMLSDEQSRLITLVGIGGIGKTRLATQAAMNALRDYADGVWMMELASLTEPDLLPQQAASVLGVSAQEAREGYGETDVLVDYLRDKDMLLVIDNCEHLIQASALFADSLLKGCPQIKLLATSREDLRIPGESIYHVSPMQLPGDDTSIDQLISYEAIDLFTERAIAARHDFQLTGENSAAVIQICRRLDGIPLAIELAAARVKILSPEQIAERLQDRFQLLISGSRTALPRQKTLEATMDWSYNLLDHSERTLLRKFAVFSGGWTLEAAETIGSSPDVDKGLILDLLSQLVEKSLVLVEEQKGSVRYRMLETVRQYGIKKLTEEGELFQAQRRHVYYFIQLAELADDGLRNSNQLDSIKALENEHDNLRRALRWAIENSDAESACRLVAALGWFWFMRGYWKESWIWLEQILGFGADTGPLLRAKAIYKAGALQLIRGKLTGMIDLVEDALNTCRNYDESEGTAWCLNLLGQADSWGYKDEDRGAARLSESIDLFSMLEDEWGVAWSLRYLGQINDNRGNYEQGISQQKESLRLFEEVGDQWNCAHSLYLLGSSYFQHGDLDQAKRAFEQSLEKCKIVEDKVMEAHAIRGLARLAIQRDDLVQAEHLSRKALEDLQKFGDENCSAGALRDLGEIARQQGNFDQSAAYLCESLQIFNKLGNDIPIMFTLMRFAALASTTDRNQVATRLLAAVGALTSESAWQSLVMVRNEHDKLTVSTRKKLGDHLFEKFSADGAGMSRDDAVALAFDEFKGD